MSRKPEPVHIVKQRRDDALNHLLGRIPFVTFQGLQFDRRGDELTAVMPYDKKLIGNVMIPALHGGATAGFMETAAIVELSWAMMWDALGCALTAPPQVVSINAETAPP